MNVFISILLLIFEMIAPGKQSPHGKNFKIDCAQCHTSAEWVVDQSKLSFNHNDTRFTLKGQHLQVQCKACHPTLVFPEAKQECYSCHVDMHQQSVGNDCSRCHNNATWIIPNVRDIHLQSRFPLVGAHSSADCNRCHTSASKLQFATMSIDCYDCHRDKYMATTQPNHQQSGYSTNCIECHRQNSYEWTASGFNHDFFPLTGGHSINCARCHGEGKYEAISSACIDCHQTNYNATTSPNHLQSKFPTTCADCHTTSPNWKPALFKQHDSESFPIYSGKHKNEWSSCTDCHKQEGNFSSFSCIDCHEHRKSAMDKEHDEERDYSYNSNACLNCHPSGNSD